MKKTRFLGLVGFAALLCGAFASLLGGRNQYESVHADPEPINVNVNEADIIINQENHNHEGRGFYFLLPVNDLPVTEWSWSDRFIGQTTLVSTDSTEKTVSTIIMKCADVSAKWNFHQMYWIQFANTNDDPNAAQLGDIITIDGKFTNSSNNSLTFDNFVVERRTKGYFTGDATVNFNADTITSLSYSGGSSNDKSIFFKLKDEQNHIKTNKEWGYTHNLGYDFTDVKITPSGGEEFTTWVALVKEYLNNDDHSIGTRYRLLFTVYIKDDQGNDNYYDLKAGDRIVLKGTTHHYYNEDVTINFDLDFVMASNTAISIYEEYDTVDLDYTVLPFTVREDSTSSYIYFIFESYLENDPIFVADPGVGWQFVSGGTTDLVVTRKDGSTVSFTPRFAKVRGSNDEEMYVLSLDPDWALPSNYSLAEGDKIEVNTVLSKKIEKVLYNVKLAMTVYCGSLEEKNPWILAAEMEPALEVEALIDAIGEVTNTSECLEKIEAAREAYDALTIKQQGIVNNADDLVAAENRYAQIVVEGLIDAIGEVTLEKENAIISARAAYEALSNDQKESFSAAKLGTLEAAEAELADLKLRAAAAEVEALIDAIGEVTANSGRAIAEAQAAYEALSSEAQAYVSNYQKLLDAQRAYKDARDQLKADEVEELIDLIGTVDGSRACLNRINDAQEAYDDLTDAQAEKVSEEKLAILQNAKTAFATALENAQAAATNAVEEFFNGLDLSKYSEENKTLIESKTQAVKASISAELVTDDLDTLVANYKNEVNAVEKLPEPDEPTGGNGGESGKKENKTCGGNIAITSAILSSAALIGFVLLSFKRKED